jgi:hypothetical protein
MSKRSTILALALAAGALVALSLASVASATHPRPGGGTPFRVPLVPSFKACTAPNSTHVAPLAQPSCTPPALESAILTTGNAGAGSGFSRLDVKCVGGAPGEVPPCSTTAGDHEDIGVFSQASDIRCAVGGIPGCPAANGDYTGGVIGQSVIRITDHSNGTPATVCSTGTGAPPCTTATVQDLTFSVLASCTATPASANGSNCGVNTTIDALLAGTVKELQRGVVSIFGIRIRDAGPDGLVNPGTGCPPACGTGDETEFGTQGIFIP